MKETLGQAATRLMSKFHENTHSANEQAAEQMKNHEAEFNACIKRGIEKYPKDFFVSLINQKERLFFNSTRTKFLDSADCPTPQWDQSVFYYKRSIGHPEYLWTVPDKYTSEQMLINLRYCPWTIDKEEKELYSYVGQFYDGTLLLKAKQLNKEIENG